MEWHMVFKASAFFSACLILQLSISNGYYWVDERSIRDTILNSSNYDPTIRPFSPMEIYSMFVLIALNYLDTAGQVMSATGALYVMWHDYRLMWDPSLYNGIYTIMVPHGSIWTPPLIVENSAIDMAYVGSRQKVHQRVYADGTVKWMIPVVSQTTCEMKILKYPFDSQHCGIKLYTWAHDERELFITHPDNVSIEYYSQNGEWDYIGSSISTDNVTDGFEIFIKLTIQVHFRRKWLFLGLSLIIPAVLNSLLMCAVFALSFQSGEKLSYALTVLLTYIVLLTLVADSLPPISTDISVLQIYLTSVMCLGTIATLLTVLTVSVYNQKPEKPRPKWLLSLCHYMLAPLVCRTRWWKACSCGSHTEGEQRSSSRCKVHPMVVAAVNESEKDSEEILTANVAGLKLKTGRTHSAVYHGGMMNSRKPTDNGGFKSPPRTDNVRLVDAFSRESTPPPPVYSAKEDGGSNDSEVNYSWKEMAELMDSAFLRIVSFVIGAGTIVLLVFFIVVY